MGSNGHFTMTIADTSSLGGTDTYVGSIDSNGTLRATVTNSNSPGVTLHATGNVTVDSVDQISMTITITNNGTTVSAAESFTRVRTVRSGKVRSELSEAFSKALH